MILKVLLKLLVKFLINVLFKKYFETLRKKVLKGKKSSKISLKR